MLLLRDVCDGATEVEWKDECCDLQSTVTDTLGAGMQYLWVDVWAERAVRFTLKSAGCNGLGRTSCESVSPECSTFEHSIPSTLTGFSSQVCGASGP